MAQKWISIDAKDPPKTKPVLCFLKHESDLTSVPQIIIAYVLEGKVKGGWLPGSILTHWMRLPEHPEDTSK